MPTWNAITIARACRAGLAALTLVILSASLASAEFGPRITIGNNYQQWSNTQSNTPFSSDCDFQTFCLVMFEPIPQQRPLIVQHVACRVNVSAGSLHFARLGNLKGSAYVDNYAYLVPVSTTGTWWAVNSPVTHLIKSGERPFLWFSNSLNTGWVIDCSISGTLQ